MELDPKCLSLNATARMLHTVRSILARRWSIDSFWIPTHSSAHCCLSCLVFCPFCMYTWFSWGVYVTVLCTCPLVLLSASPVRAMDAPTSPLRWGRTLLRSIVLHACSGQAGFDGSSSRRLDSVRLPLRPLPCSAMSGRVTPVLLLQAGP